MTAVFQYTLHTLGSAQFTETLSDNLPSTSLPDLKTAVSLYRGEFLEGMTLPDAPEFELWLLYQRAHTRRLLERGLLELTQRLSQKRDYDAAIHQARPDVFHYEIRREDG